MIDRADDHYELDISRAQLLLHWSPQHRLLATLPHMVKALLDDPYGWYQHHDLQPPADLEERHRMVLEESRAC
jgi:hypothetical protein